MSKIGMGIDNWKLPIFKKMLAKRKYKYKEYKLTKDTTLLLVIVEDFDVDKFTNVVISMENAANRSKKH